MKKALILTNHYLDQNNGGSNATKAHIRAFSELYENCTLIYPEHNDNGTSLMFLKNINAIPCRDNRSKFTKGLDVYRGVLNRLPGFVKNHLKTNTYDIIVIDHSITAAGLERVIKRFGAKIVSIHHNNESRYLSDNKRSLLYRYPYQYFAKKAERELLRFSDVNLALTEYDAQSFREMFPGRNIHCYDMGTFQYMDLPTLIEDKGYRKCQTFAITGSMNFQQSQKPVIEFVERYFPIILQKIPEARLIIAGRDPSESIQEICSRYSQITLIPNPQDITSVINQADIYVCPTNTGSGVKLRVMDGLKLGIPVLGHVISLNGYETIKKDGFFFDYDDESSFERALVDIINLKYKKQYVYDSFLSYFGFKAGKERLRLILQKENLI